MAGMDSTAGFVFPFSQLRAVRQLQPSLFRDSLPAALLVRYPEATRQIDVKELLDLH